MWAEDFKIGLQKKNVTYKVKGKLPAMPCKKAGVIENLAGSPRTRKILIIHGVLKPQKRKEKLQV